MHVMCPGCINRADKGSCSVLHNMHFCYLYKHYTISCTHAVTVCIKSLDAVAV